MKYKLSSKTEMTIGNYLLDVSKLIFGGVILGTVMDMTDSKASLLVTGVLSVAVIALSGLFLIDKNNKKEK